MYSQEIINNMNETEWKKLSRQTNRPPNFFKFYNEARKRLGILSGYVIHHLRDTEEQRIFNDTYYERWGIDFDDNLRF